ncbi:hypothetical protein FG386_002402 [Cryptosporidium ryanae]|uniref:uncharacterized protein n=1 Tax=Cryptosporidium ryanae TaxID=515981 RepID=UPI00351A745D|nr:hypothetical protein FG386_002402 [Cryptosporidium ryanae]
MSGTKNKQPDENVEKKGIEMGVRRRESNKKELFGGGDKSERLKSDGVGAGINDNKMHSNVVSDDNIPYKPVVVSFFLLVVGVCFIFLGVSLVLDSEYSNSLPSIILGVLCLIPGSYYSFVTIQVLRGVSEYNMELIEISQW